MKKTPIVILPLLALVAAGCSPDERLAEFAQEATSQQARQNQAVTELNREASESHRRVVEAAERSRQDIAQLDRDLQQQRDKIDGERKALADERHRESLLAPVLNTLSLMLVAALPLVLAAYLLHGLKSQDEEVSEALLQNLGSDAQLLLPQRETPALPHEETAAENENAESPPF
jgi:hypothetical protein